MYCERNTGMRYTNDSNIENNKLGTVHILSLYEELILRISLKNISVLELKIFVLNFKVWHLIALEV